MCPVADAEDTYAITLQLTYDVPPTADRTRWGGLYFGVTTDDCPDDVDTSTGYLVALRWDGVLAVFRTAVGRLRHGPPGRHDHVPDRHAACCPAR